MLSFTNITKYIKSQEGGPQIMPTVTVPKSILKSFKKKYNDDEFNSMLFDFGLEIDEITETSYKIEIPANRYDLLCVNGLVNSLKCYLEGDTYQDLNYLESELQVTSDCETRPFIACAIIKDFQFTQETYDDLIDYQERIHAFIGQDRSVVAIGIHEFDRLKFPIRYTELRPTNIRFRPFNSNNILRGESIKEFLKDSPLLKYCDLLEDNRYPVLISDSNILSLPPIINSNYSKISLETKNIFIEATGTDFNKVNLALKLLLYNFRGSHALSVKVNNVSTPIFNNISFYFYLSEINKELDLSLSGEEVLVHTRRMMHNSYIVPPSKYSKIKRNLASLKIGSTLGEPKFDSLIKVITFDVRSDVLHKVDILEDICISYGFNNFSRSFPLTFSTGSILPINSFADKLRYECCILGFLEILGLVLGNKTSPDQINILHSKSSECESPRNSLIPSLLKSVSYNSHASLPIKIFEVGEVIENTVNKLHLSCLIAGKVAKIEEIQGVLSCILKKCNVKNYEYDEKDSKFYYKRRGGVAKYKNIIIANFGVISGEMCREYKVPLACVGLTVYLEEIFKVFNK